MPTLVLSKSAASFQRHPLRLAIRNEATRRLIGPVECACAVTRCGKDPAEVVGVRTRAIAGEFVIMAKNTLDAKTPKDLPAKKPVNGGFVIYGRNVTGDSTPTEGLAFNYSKIQG